MTSTTPHPNKSSDGLMTETEREQAVLALVADGLTNREIGRQLGLSEHTVRFLVRILMQKLRASNRTKLALLYTGGEKRSESGYALRQIVIRQQARINELQDIIAASAGILRQARVAQGVDGTGPQDVGR